MTLKKYNLYAIPMYKEILYSTKKLKLRSLNCDKNDTSVDDNFKIEKVNFV